MRNFVFIICAEVIIYLLYNLHGCTLLCVIAGGEGAEREGGQITNFWEKNPSSTSNYYKRMT